MKSIPILCLLLLAASPEAAGEPVGGAALVSPVFGWPAGLRATVTSSKTRTRVTDQRTSRSATSSYTIRADPEGENLRIHFADPRIEMGGDNEPLPAAAQAQLVAQITDLIPDFVVTKAGEFVTVHDLPTYQERLRDFLGSLFPANLDSEMLTQIQGMLTSEAYLNGRAAEQWNTLVGAWVGADLELGAEYAYSHKEPVPVFPGEQILMNYSFAAARLLPCSRSGKDRSCAELVMRSSADPEDTKRMIQGFLSRFAGEALPETPVFQTMEIDNLLRVVTEPDGMVPHGYTLTKTIKGSIRLGEEVQDFEQVDETEVSYAYPEEE